jgi:hypothetical protein
MTSACIIASEHSTAQFTFAKETRTFIAEASDLGWSPGSFARHIWLTSARTGERVLFSIRGTERDNEGDVTGWRFEGRCESGLLHLVVLND